MPQNNIKLFENQPIRSAWDEEKEEWYFSVVDIIRVLTNQLDRDGARNYWKVLKKRLKDEGADQLVTNCNQLKFPAKDGKNRLTDVMDTEQVLRLIQSIPSKKAEPFKQWLAQVGRERIEEAVDPELTIDRALGGEVAGVARKELEKRTGKSVISPRNATELGTIVAKLIEAQE